MPAEAAEELGGALIAASEDYLRRQTCQQLLGALQSVDPQWLEDVKLVYGDYELVPMTADGDRGIVCQMYVAKESLPYLRQFESPQTAAIQQALSPLLEEKPSPMFEVLWDPELALWRSYFSLGDLMDE